MSEVMMMQQKGLNLARLNQLQYLRPTSLQVFEDCAYTWAMKYMLEGVEAENKWTKIGTQAHKVIELHVKYIIGHTTSDVELSAELKKAAVLLGDEFDNLVEYLGVLTDLILVKGYSVMPNHEGQPAIEQTWSIPVYQGMPPIQGTMDLVLVSPTGAILIVDHKTNRGYQRIDEWANKLQPLLYGWATKRLWPGFREYRFMIGYVNIKFHNEWVITELDDASVSRRIWNIWERMTAYATACEWPRTISKQCQYCPVKDTCPDMVGTMNSLKDSFIEKANATPLPERLQWIKNIRKAAEAIEKSVTAEMMAQITADGPIVHGDFVYSITYSESRKVEFSAAWPAIQNAMNECGGDPIEWQRLISLYNDLFTVKVGGVDKLAKASPMLGDVVNKLVKKVSSSNPSLNEEAIKRQIT